MNKIILLSFIAILLITGCAYVATDKQFFSQNAEFALQGNYHAAIEAVENAREEIYKKKDRVLYYLDLGMLLHYKGEYERSNTMLSRAELAIEELFTKSISKAALSMLLNDNTLDYSGEDYEDIYINIFKALNYINLDDEEAAFVEVRRVNEKLNLLEDKYAKLTTGLNASKDAVFKLEAGENRFFNSALSRYLSMLLYRNDRKWDDVRIASERFHAAWNEQPEIYTFKQPDVSNTVQKNSTSHLNLFCFTGLSPDKRSKTWWIRTWNDHIFIGASKESLSGDKVSTYVDMFYWEDVEENLFFKFEIPVMQSRMSEIEKVELIIDGKKYDPAKVENIDQVAKATFEIKKPITYLKTIIRTVSKGLLSKKGKDKITEGVQSELLSSLINLSADLAVAATEQADLRISHYFPKYAHIADIPLDPGIHQLKINYYNKYGVLIYSDDKGNIEIDEKGLNIVESFCLQ